MNLTYGEAKEPDRLTVRLLLSEAHLPTESIDTGTTEFFLASKRGKVVGVAGFEFYGEDALLRSVAVSAGLRNHGLGSQLVDQMITEATRRNVRRIFLLTESAQKFFAQKGFAVTDRYSTGNPALERSTQFASSCPASAVCMKMDLHS